jgi:hypothetical protein
MKYITYILLAISLLLPIALKAQTPYDTFAPEASRPMLDADALYEEIVQENRRTSLPFDTILCAAVIDIQSQSLYIVSLTDGTILASVPLTDEVQKWLSVDPLVDKYIYASPYIYCNGNPIKYVDPNGEGPQDKAAGWVVGIITNIIPFAGLTNVRDSYVPDNPADYNASLQGADALARGIGMVLAAQGGANMAVGLAVSEMGLGIAATGVGAPEGAGVATVGGAMVATGALQSACGSVLMANSTTNQAKGYNRGGSNTQSKSTGYGNCRPMTKNEIGKFLNDKDWHHKPKYKHAYLKEFEKELKGATNFEFYVDKKTHHIYLKGNKSDAWVDTGNIF